MIMPGCKQIDKLTQFNMDYEETVTIPSTIGINVPFNMFTPDITTNSEETFEINDTRKDLIEEIVLKEMTMEVINPAGEDFSFLKSVEIFISAEDLDEQKIAWKDDTGTNPGSKIELETSSADLKDYIKKDSFTLRIKTVTDELLLSDYDIKIDSKFFVDAKILGV
jgi:hypothetical protein